MTGRASDITGTAVACIVGRVYFTAICLFVVIAIRKTYSTGAVAHSCSAGRSNMIRTACSAAASAIVHVRENVNLAAIGLFIAIAIGKAAVACTVANP